MSKDVIHVKGEDKVVREDTAKAFRGVNWAIISIGAFVLIAGVLFFLFLLVATRDGNIESPANINSANSR
ncbi:MAG: hypothetical protein IPL32_02980 [Chloracidobacterium sp.]|nr:hypothetical protein [Chloracidobacterium sp.]